MINSPEVGGNFVNMYIPLNGVTPSDPFLFSLPSSSFIDAVLGQFVITDLPKSQLADLYKQHLEQKETEEKLCKWRDADMLQAYEQDVLNNRSKTVAQLLDSWQNPVFTAPEKVR